MKKLVLFAVASIVMSYQAQAEVLTCNFTEPFWTITLDTENKTGTFSGVEEEDIYENSPIKVGVTNSSRGLYFAEIDFDGSRSVLLVDTYTGGSDGMSETLYPMNTVILTETSYSVQDAEKIARKRNPNRLNDIVRDASIEATILTFGGCYSDSNPAKDPLQD